MGNSITRLGAGLIACAVIALMAGGSPASASEVSEATIEQRRQVLFEVMLQQPDNLDAAFEYAALSAQVGDYEGAVSTLERMLIFAPGLPRLQLELGVLYYRLGSFETARTYFNDAVSGPAVPPDVRQKVDEYLAAIDAALDPNKFTAATMFGIRWQSNANSAPNSGNVNINGLPFVLNSNFTEKDDFSVFASTTAHYTRDLQNQGDRFEVDYVSFSDLHFDQTDVDVAVAEITMGPSFNLGRFMIDDAYLGTYAILGGAILDRRGYYGAVGAGVRLVKRWNTRTESAWKAEYRHKWFNDTKRLPTSSQRDGDEYRLTGDTSYLLSPRARLSIGGRFAYEDARRSYYDNWELGGQAALTVMLNPPPGTPEYPWTANLYAGYVHREFRRPDPAINAGQRQNDDEFWVSGNLIIPVTKRLAVVPQVEYREVNSNYDIKEYNAFTGLLALMLRW